MTFRPVDFFQSDASAARGQFLNICEDAGLDVWSKGEAGEDGYIIDIARIGSPDAASVIVLTSGVSEGEGLCASAVQCCALAGPVRRELPRDVGVLFVHAIAPCWKKIVPNSPCAVTERAWEDALLVAADSQYEKYVRGKKVADELIEGSLEIRSDEDGVEGVVSSYLERAKRIGIIDVRTGPGEFGHCDVIACAGRATPAGKRAALWFGARTDLGNISSIAVPSPLAQSLIESMPPAELAAVVMEFGTYSLKVMLGSMPGRMFYPENSEWQLQVWQKAHAVIQQAMGAMERSPAPRPINA